MQAVHVRIGSDDDFCIAEIFQIFINVQGFRDVEKFLVVVNIDQLFSVAVQGFPAEGEDRLIIRVPALDQTAACGVTFHQENHGFIRKFGAVAEMVFAVLELAVAETQGLGHFLGIAFDLVERLTQVFVALDFFQQFFGFRRILEQVVDHGSLDRVFDPCFHIRITQFVFGLGFKDRLLDLDRNRTDDAVPQVPRVKFAAEMFVHRPEQTALERRKVRAAVRRILTVHKGEIFFPAFGSMAEGKLDPFVLIMDGGVKFRFSFDLIAEQILQSVFGVVTLIVQVQGKSAVQIGIHPETAFHKLDLDLVIDKFFRVRREGDPGAIPFFRIKILHALKFAVLECGAFALAGPDGFRHKPAGKRIDRLGADPVHPDRKLVLIGVELAAGIDVGDAVHQFAGGDPAPVVTDREGVFFDGDIDTSAVSHHIFVDRIIQHFLEQDVNPVVLMGTIAQPSDIHTGTLADVFKPLEGLNIIFAV